MGAESELIPWQASTDACVMMSIGHTQKRRFRSQDGVSSSPGEGQVAGGEKSVMREWCSICNSAVSESPQRSHRD